MSDEYEDEIRGKTEEELERKAKDYYENVGISDNIPFEIAYCLTEIPESRQPEDYEGPQRYCTQWAERNSENAEGPEDFHSSCRMHGGAAPKQDGTPENIEDLRENHNNKPTYIKHGMYTAEEHLKEHFTEEDQKLFDRVMSWAEAYGFEEGTPEYDILEQTAVERVRGARSAKYVLEEQETQDSPVFDEEGNIVTHEDAENVLSEEHQRQRKLILKMMKELGLTPKERSNMDLQEAETNASEVVAEIARESLEEGEYDPEEFEDEGG